MEAGDRKTLISFHDRRGLCAYGATLTVPLNPTDLFKGSLPIVGSDFDIRAFDHVSGATVLNLEQGS